MFAQLFFDFFQKSFQKNSFKRKKKGSEETTKN